MGVSKPKFIDLFAGCGGLSLGLEQAGFEPLFVNELNIHAMETYLINREKQHPLLRSKYNISDVKKLVAKKGKFLHELMDGFKVDYGLNVKKGELDLLAGGPPCQGYSGIGHRRSYKVDKQQLPSNYLYQDMAYAIHILRPKIFLFENVRGLLTARWSPSGEKNEIWKDVLKTFNSISEYTVRFNLVVAKDYGVAQNRPRVLLVGIRDDINVTPIKGLCADGFLPEPFGKYPTIVQLLGDLLDPNYVNGGKTSKYPAAAKTEIQRWLRTVPESGKISKKGSFISEHEYSNHKIEVVKKFKYMIGHNGAIHPSMKTKKFAQRLLPEVWGDKGPSITATSLPDDYVHYCQPRTLSVREWARLQMFPDWYEFAGKRTTGGIRRAGNPQAGIFDREVPKYTQIGNAVPVRLAQSVGEHFLKLLKS
jgi:DNA (cytosine-5)-methyltransferase 1